MSYKTLRVRLKDKHKSVLCQMARDVNTVFNFSQDLSLKILNRESKFASAYDMQKYTKGSSLELSINSQTVQAVTDEYVIRRKQYKKRQLRWRKSYGKQRSLGWIPFKGQTITYKHGQLSYNKNKFNLWHSCNLSSCEIKSGCFTEDSKGRWYACLVVKLPEVTKKESGKEIGIDLGLKDLATCSDGTVISNPKYFNKYQEKLAKAQRANKKKQVRNIHTKIKNSRKDYLHKESTRLVKESKMIVVGNLNLKASKSVNDTSFAGFRTMLEYKCKNAGVDFKIVSEYNTTRCCSSCGALTGPTGITQLGIREWSCICGANHDRDVNSAINILALGHESLAVGAVNICYGDVTS